MARFLGPTVPGFRSIFRKRYLARPAELLRDHDLCRNAFVTLRLFPCHPLPVSHRHVCLGWFPAVPVGVPGGAWRAVIYLGPVVLVAVLVCLRNQMDATSFSDSRACDSRADAVMDEKTYASEAARSERIRTPDNTSRCMVFPR